jgi:hypothetical protein
MVVPVFDESYQDKSKRLFFFSVLKKALPNVALHIPNKSIDSTVTGES